MAESLGLIDDVVYGVDGAIVREQLHGVQQRERPDVSVGRSGPLDGGVPTTHAVDEAPPALRWTAGFI